MSKSALDQLKKMTTLVIDTGDIEAVKKFRPTDSTTNPSLILSAYQKPEYKPLVENAYQYSKKHAGASAQQMSLFMDKLFVNVGCEILQYVEGRVSTEVDARLSFDVEGSIAKAQSLIALYKEMGIDKERVLIKLASTWEGGLAAKQLEKMGIHCNLTLMFSLPQAIHCANSHVTLISPFVGRILDWYKKSEEVNEYAPSDDPGVKSVTTIYNYFKKFNIKTQIMGASFRNKDQILELAGCDLLTISPQFLEELQKLDRPIERKLKPEQAQKMDIKEIDLDEKKFRLMFNEDAMATEKLSEGIRNFAKDAIKLENILKDAYKIE